MLDSGELSNQRRSRSLQIGVAWTITTFSDDLATADLLKKHESWKWKLDENSRPIERCLLLDLQAAEKPSIIDEMIKKFDRPRLSRFWKHLKKEILARELWLLVWVMEIAMPQQNAAVKEATVLFAKSNKGGDYEGLDGQTAASSSWLQLEGCQWYSWQPWQII